MDNPSPIHILLVEDDIGHQELIRRAFAPLQDRYHFSLATDLQSAFDAIATSPPDLLIVDLLLPDGKGSKLLTAASENPRFPAIVMTSHGDEQAAVDAMKAGALDYVVKSPETLSDMPHIVERALREWEHIVERKRAEELLRTSLHEKTLLLQEIHHRTRNNMQVIDSLLEFQTQGIDDPSTLRIFRSIRNRIRSMALVQEKLYISDLTSVNLEIYLRELTASLVQSCRQDTRSIAFTFELEAIVLTIDTAVPFGLMVNELLSNALDHAFSEGHEGGRAITIGLRLAEDGMLEFRIGDNGKGFSDDIDIEQPSTLGFTLVKMLVVHQLRGNFQCLERKNGAQFLVRIKPPQYKKRI